MKNKTPVFTILCVMVLFVFAAFLTWYIPSQASVLSGIEETKRSLETSRGREGKQQDEYDKAVQDLPVIQAELREKKPLVEEAEKNVADLKNRRNELRQEKEDLELKLSESSGEQEVKPHE